MGQLKELHIQLEELHLKIHEVLRSYRPHLATDEQTQITNQLNVFCKSEGLPFWSIDELLQLNYLNRRQETWLENLQDEWDACL